MERSARSPLCHRNLSAEGLNSSPIKAQPLLLSLKKRNAGLKMRRFPRSFVHVGVWTAATKLYRWCRGFELGLQSFSRWKQTNKHCGDGNWLYGNGALRGCSRLINTRSFPEGLTTLPAPHIWKRDPACLSPPVKCSAGSACPSPQQAGPSEPSWITPLTAAGPRAALRFAFSTAGSLSNE